MFVKHELNAGAVPFYGEGKQTSSLNNITCIPKSDYSGIAEPAEGLASEGDKNLSLTYSLEALVVFLTPYFIKAPCWNTACYTINAKKTPREWMYLVRIPVPNFLRYHSIFHHPCL